MASSDEHIYNVEKLSKFEKKVIKYHNKNMIPKQARPLIWSRYTKDAIIMIILVHCA